MAGVLEFPKGRGFDRPYWLSRCEGFLVQDAAGMRIGRVAELQYVSRLDQPDALVVRAGRLGSRLLIYATEAVQTIVPAEDRLMLSAQATPTRSQRRSAG